VVRYRDKKLSVIAYAFFTILIKRFPLSLINMELFWWFYRGELRLNDPGLYVHFFFASFY
jgi:hypothetical protein